MISLELNRLHGGTKIVITITSTPLVLLLRICNSLFGEVRSSL